MNIRVLYVIVCGAPPTKDVGQLVRLAQAAGWDVCVLASPTGRKFTNPEHAAHPAFAENIARLRSWGVTVLTRTEPGFPWARVLAALAGPAR